MVSAEPRRSLGRGEDGRAHRANRGAFPLRHKAPADPSETARFVDRSAAPFGGGGENGASPGGQCLDIQRQRLTKNFLVLRKVGFNAGRYTLTIAWNYSE